MPPTDETLLLTKDYQEITAIQQPREPEWYCLPLKLQINSV